MNHESTITEPGQESRERLIQAALGLFTQRGFAAASIREICQAAGVSKPVLYYYFKSKEGLYLEIMNGVIQLFDLRLSELSVSTGTVRQRLHYFLGGMLESACSNLDVVRLAYSIYFGPPQGAPFIDFNRFFDLTIALVNGLIKEGVRSGELCLCDQEALSWSLVGSYQTILEEQLCQTPPRIGRDGLVRVIDQILSGVTPSKKEHIKESCHEIQIPWRAAAGLLRPECLQQRGGKRPPDR